MTSPRLVGEQVALVPVPATVVPPVLAGDRAGVVAALAPAGLHPADGWPHDDTAAALSASADDLSRSWLVTLAGVVVGDCGWKGPPDPDGVVEIGYGLAAEARRRGTGTAAVGLLVAWTLSQPRVTRVAAEVLPGNEPSRRLLRRLGFEEQPTHDWWLSPRLGAKVRGRHVC